MKFSRIQELEKLILFNKELYYKGKAEISDEAYDKLEDELKKIDPENPILKLVGHMQIDNNLKVAHQKKMLSLDKTYDQNDLFKWMGKEPVLSVYKIDGSSCSLIYKDGHLSLAKTRGDGQFGENITKKAMFISDIPKGVSLKEEFEVRGEIYCKEIHFVQLSKEMEELGLEKPSSLRNIVAGLLGRKENIHLANYLSFKAFDLIDDQKLKLESDKLKILEHIGFDIPDYEVHHSSKDVARRIEDAKKFMEAGDYLIDGLVFVINDLKIHSEMGETSHHPRYKMAFKFAGETKVSEIERIEWGVSRNGVLTPVAHVNPIELSGAMITKVTLHNYGLVKNYELKRGDKIEIIRSGEVIPKFLGIIERGQGQFTYPEECPSCQGKLRIQDIWLVCENENCPDKIQEGILHYIQKAGIDDLSDKRLHEMIKKGLVRTIPDLYRLQVDDFLTLDKVKEKMATKIFQNIQKTKKQKLATFISAIGVEGVSITKSEKIIAQGHNTIEKILHLNLEQMLQIEGFADKSSQAFLDSIKNKKQLIEDLLRLGVQIEADEISSGEGPLTSQKFCITGELSMPRAEFEKLIKKNGGVMVSSVSKNTTHLITNEKDSQSSKFVKAKELGISIKTEQEILQMIEGHNGQN